MRVEIALLIGANAKPEIRSISGLQQLMRHYNPNASLYNYLMYGCNCNLLIAGRFKPSETTSFGQPVDELDSTCQKYRNCLQCVTEKYGSECRAEATHYSQSIKYLVKLFT